MKILTLTSYGPTLASVRGPLLRAMVERGHEVMASAPDCSPAVISRLTELDVKYHRLPLARRGLNPIRDLIYCDRVFRLLRREQIDLCFLYTVKAVVFGSFAARLAGISRTYSMITGLGYTFMARTALQRLITQVTERLYRWALRSNRWVFFQNADDRELFIRRGIVPADKSSVVNGSGVDLEFYTPFPVPSGPPVFLMIGRLLRAKGVGEYLAAAREIKRRHPECRFKLIGHSEKGPDAISLDVVREHVRDGILEYLPEVSDVRPDLRACTVFVLPSYREGVPRAVLEAMACGRAIITTTEPGCRETVVKGVNGLAVPVRDVPALTAAMERFINDESLASRMGMESRRLAEQKFDVREVNRVMLERMGL